MKIHFILILALLCLISHSTKAQEEEKITVSGYLTDSISKEVLLFASIQIKGSTVGANTNEYGFFSIDVPKGKPTILQVSYIGYQTKEITINSAENVKIDIGINVEGAVFEEVVIKSDQNAGQEEVRSTQMSKMTIQVEQVKTLPSIGGEVDLIKVAQLLPGVQRGGEGGTGMYIRGGDADQNLVLLDEATVYNVGHLFGFFSVFNPDAIKDMTIIKGGFPAHYGGRLSAVLDLRMWEGNKKRFHVDGGIGLLSSRITVQGPIVKDKVSFLLSGRRTYIDQVLKIAKIDLPYYFYDVYAKLNWTATEKDRFFLSGYFGQDVLNFQETVEEGDSIGGGQDELGFGFTLGNFTQTFRWNHLYSSKLFSNLSLIHTNFNYNIRGQFVGNSVLIQSSIRDLGVKFDFHNFISDRAKFRFGMHTIVHFFRPNIVSTQGEITEFLESSKGAVQTTVEPALYANFEYDVTKDWKVNGGLRLSSAVVNGGFYAGIEPRFSTSYAFNDNHSVKFSYSRMYQYMHLVSSSTVALPTDLWYPVSKNVKPQNADQVAVGYNWYIEPIDASIVVEGYYKWMRNLIEYKEGSNLILNNNFEDQLLSGTGDSYGAEFLFKKDRGRVNGWVGYTLAWSSRMFEGLNKGKRFWAKYDRRHYLTVVLNFEVAKWFTISAIWEYASGARFTPLLGQYLYPDASLTNIEIIPIYGERNSIRMSASHRLDMNLVFRTRPHKKTGFINEFFIGGYNMYNRATPFQINITLDEETGRYKYQQPGLFGFIPSVAWNFKF